MGEGKERENEKGVILKKQRTKESLGLRKNPIRILVFLLNSSTYKTNKYQTISGKFVVRSTATSPDSSRVLSRPTFLCLQHQTKTLMTDVWCGDRAHLVTITWNSAASAGVGTS